MRQALADRPAVIAALGDTSPPEWSVDEVSDGNMNAVFRVSAHGRSVIAKHAPPFIRVIGESWPFPAGRIAMEHAALTHHNRICPDYVPGILDFDAAQALLVMEDLSGLVIGRRAFIDGLHLPRLADQLGDYLARSLFFTSDFALSTVENQTLMGAFIPNAALCATTAEVIFSGPYWDAPLNRHNPLLDPLVARIRADQAWHLAAAELGHLFRTQTEALIHGDLHTGSIMVSPDTTKVIDAEWAFHGPMGFDIGALIGNMLIAYASQPGHAMQQHDNPQARDDYAAWLLACIEALWQDFTTRFRALAHDRRAMGDDALLSLRLFNATMVDDYLDRFFARLLVDSAGFAGAKMTRRVIGISHVQDLEEITDPVARARCEAHVLAMARKLVVDRGSIQTISDITNIARQPPSILLTLPKD